MKKILLVICFLLAFTADKALSYVIDAPHNESQNVFCGDCHTYSLWWQFSPSDGDVARRQLVSSLCEKCHSASGSAPLANTAAHVVTHSMSAMGDLHHTPWDWTVQERFCIDCHTPHFQEQLDWTVADGVSDADKYVVQGDMVLNTLNDNLDNTSSFHYVVTSFNKEAWNNPADWAQKTKPGRGLLLVVSASGIDNTFEVSSAIEDAPPGSGTGTMTVNGVIPNTYNGSSFGLAYGQLIKKQIGVDTTFSDQNDYETSFTPVPVAVKFFDGRGGFVNAAEDGVCQVCHSKTKYFAQNSWPEDHINIKGVANAATLRCTHCHDHLFALGHGSDGASGCVDCHNDETLPGVYSKHISHLSLEILCSRCHDLNNMRDVGNNVILKDGADLSATVVCVECHHDGTDITPGDGNNPPLQADFKSGWTDPGYLFPSDCQGCHASPPSYTNGAPKSNSHAAHNYSCEVCHHTTTLDGSTLNTSVGATHTNGSYSIAAGAPYSIGGYLYNASGGTCSNVSCHNDNNPTWGSTLLCEDCHLGSADRDDFVSTDNQIVAAISSTEWTTSGHGRNSGTSYAVTGNSGAGLACYYCHDKGVAHGDSLNRFRLANVGTADSAESWNGVCWACHKAGSSPGYDPDGAGTDFTAIDSTLKIGSYHFGDRHRAGSNKSGAFCWDCHDPHGDSNISMIHKDVAIETNPLSGFPLNTSPVSFVAKSSGADFAVTTLPGDPDPTVYNGICNVCHTNTGNYTSTSGNGHEASTRCTVCHKHTYISDPPDVLDKEKAFFVGDCTECHNTIQDDGNGLPVGGRRAVAAEFPVSIHAHYGGNLDSGDCTICHDQTTHADGYVDLLDADGNGTYRFVHKEDLSSDPDLSDFCLSCHDADGASRLVNAFDPFNSGNQQPVQPDVASKFKGTLQYTEYYAGSEGYGGSERKVNSHHDISDAGQTYSSGAKLECLNCHGAHIVSDVQKIADPDDTSRPWGLLGGETMNGFCLKCHDGGTGPNTPDFPAGVNGPILNYPTNPFPTPPPPEKTPNTSCGTGLVWDCAGRCVDAVNAAAWVGDGFCDDTTYGIDLRCPEFQNDLDDCQCYGQDCSWLGGIDSCKNVKPPWYIDFSWTNAAHGGDSKRSWPEYVQNPQAPSYELNCTDCHDPHGSAWEDGTGVPVGNPYLIRDVVDGTGYIDDDCRFGANSQNCVPSQYPGTAGDVKIIINGFNPDFAQLCVKCHANWYNASIAHMNGGDDCLRCHSHGALFGGKDWGANGNLHTPCPAP